MRAKTRAFAAVAFGGTLVWAMFWLVESVLPGAVSISMGIGRLTMLIVLLAVALGIGSWWQTPGAAAFLFGAGLGWAVHEIGAIGLCQSDLLFRPCTVDEIAWLVGPPVALLLVAGGALVTARRGRRGTHPSERRIRLPRT